MREIPVVYCFDDNYSIPAAVAIYSMVENGSANVFWRVIVLSSDISEYNKVKLSKMTKQFSNISIEFRDMEGKFTELMKKTKKAQQFTKEMFYKFLVPDILQGYDSAIVSDVDIVWTGDLSLMSTVSANVYFNAAQIITPKMSWLEKYNKSYEQDFSQEEMGKLISAAGFYVMNLQKMREDNISDRCINFALSNAERLIQPEQDVFNLVCYPNIGIMPDNALVPTYYYGLYDNDGRIKQALQRPIQLHYASFYKPWIYPDAPYSNIWFDFLAKTPFFEDYQSWARFFNASPQKPIVEKLFFGIKKKVLPLPVGNFGPNKVSILCLSYNHKKFIRKALNSFLMQETNFPFVVYVADDASTDGTQEIILEYAKKYPDIFRPILREVNVGPAKNAVEALHKVDSPYLALCDGDDFWVDNKKLQKQVDFLDKNKKYDVVCGNCLFHYTDGSESDHVFDAVKYAGKSTLNFEKYLYKRAIASCTAMLRWRLMGVVPKWIERHVAVDFSLFLLHSAYGNIKILPDVFSQYNIHAQGVSRKHLESDYQKKMNDVVKYVDKWTYGIQKKEIKKYFLNKNKE